MKSSDPTLRKRNINGLVYIDGIKHAHDNSAYGRKTNKMNT